MSDKKIIDSWRKNTSPWITAIRTGAIESRQLCTNQAIVDAVMDSPPKHVLDIGCGEGWLAHKLTSMGIPVTGIDIIPEFIAAAQRDGGGDFHVVSYESLIEEGFDIDVDTVVCNFSLLGEESVKGIFQFVSRLLKPGGRFIVQTLHPVAACGGQVYENGWRQGSWLGFGSEFTDPAPWYFRTLETWLALFPDHWFELQVLREPTLVAKAEPVSALFIARYIGS